MRDAAGFLGTGASLASDLTLLAYLLLLVPGMLLGFYFARRKKFSPHHKLVMTTVVIINWILIGFLMLVSYREGVIPFLSAEFSGDPRVALPIVHGVIGLTAQILATYLALRMWFEKVLPRFVMVRNIKVYMRFTLAMWIITAVLGVSIYAIWYAVPTAASTDIPPAATPELAATEELQGNSGAQSMFVSNVNPAATIEVTPPAPAATPEFGPEFTPELRPAFTAEVMPAFTSELLGRDALRATEDAMDDAFDATEDAIKRSGDRAARDALRATEDAWDDMMDATEDAIKRQDDDDD